MMKALTHNIQQEREDQRDRSAQLFMWCIVVSMHQDDGIGASRLLRACNEMDAFEKKYQTAILYGSSKNATDAMRENLKGICDFEVRLPVDRAPRGRREEQLRMASNQGAEIAWLVMAATCHETFGYGRDRLARLKQNSMNNYKQYLEWEKEDKDLALDRLRRCVQDALNSVDEAPTIDPESLRGHAKWVKDKELKFIIVDDENNSHEEPAICCTHCNAKISQSDFDSWVWNFCPVCGFKMEDETEEQHETD